MSAGSARPRSEPGLINSSARIGVTHHGTGLMPSTERQRQPKDSENRNWNWDRKSSCRRPLLWAPVERAAVFRPLQHRIFSETAKLIAEKALKRRFFFQEDRKGKDEHKTEDGGEKRCALLAKSLGTSGRVRVGNSLVQSTRDGRTRPNDATARRWKNAGRRGCLTRPKVPSVGGTSIGRTRHSPKWI